MSTRTTTTQGQLIDELLVRDFTQKKVGVVDLRVMQDRTVFKFANNVEKYAMRKIPKDFYQGVPDIFILYRLANLLIEEWVPHFAADTPETYVAGTIAKRIEAVGYEYSSAVKFLTTTLKSKSSVRNAVEVITSLSVDPLFLTQTIPSINQDFIHTMLADPTTRRTILGRLTTIAIPVQNMHSYDSVMSLAARISMGRGEAIPSEYYQSHLSLRSLVLTLLRTMVNASIARPELFYDILPAYSLFIMYVNITENESVYDTAFPAISFTNTDSVYMQRVTSCVKMLATMFTKIGFTSKAFNGVLSAALLSEFFTLFPDLIDATLWTEPNINIDGYPIIDFSQKSFAEVNTIKFKSAEDVFKMVLPSMFKNYVEEVIKEYKQATGVDVLLTSIVDQLQRTGNGGNSQLLPNLTPEALLVATTLTDPRGHDALPIHRLVEARTQELYTFIQSFIFPMTESLYQLSITLKQAYERMLKSLGTPSGSIIPGVNVEIELDDSKVNSIIPAIDSFNTIPYSRLDTVYSFPFFVSPLSLCQDITDNDDVKVSHDQVWTFEHLLFRYVRPYTLFLKYVMTGEIPGLAEAPRSPRLSIRANEEQFEKWSWPADAIPTPSFMHDTGFAFTLIPFNYTFDTVQGRISNDGPKINSVMTRSSKIPTLSYMSYSQVLNSYTINGAVDPLDISLAVAGMMILYQLKPVIKNGKPTTDLTFVPIIPPTPTIYGMPTVLFMHANIEDVNSAVTIGEYCVVRSRASNSIGKRIICDSKFRSPREGFTIGLLHKYIPRPRPLAYKMMSLRNGFVLNVPFIKPYFNTLLKAGVNALTINRKGARELALSPTTPENTNYVDLHRYFSEYMSIFYVNPMDGSGIKKEAKGADIFFNTYAQKTDVTEYPDMKTFIEKEFDEVLGWSNVIAPYPHFMMRDRYEELGFLHLESFLRPITTKLYFDVQRVHATETIRVLALAPNIIETMDALDESRFYGSDVTELSSVNIGVVKTEFRKSPKTNANAPGELQTPAGVPVTENSLQGQSIQASTGDPILEHEVQASQISNTLNPIIKETTSGQGTTLGFDSMKSTPVQGSSGELAVKDGRGFNKPVLIDSSGVKTPSPTENGPNDLGQGLDMGDAETTPDQLIEKNKKIIGAGDVEDKAMTLHDKTKGKKFKKSKTEQDSDDDDDLNDATN